MRASESPFESYIVKAHFVVRLFSVKKHGSAICHSLFLSKATGHFRNRLLKVWSDRRKLALSEKNTFWNKTLADIFLLFICQSSYCPNLRANKQISSDMKLSKGTPKVIRMFTFRSRTTFLRLLLITLRWDFLVAKI